MTIGIYTSNRVLAEGLKAALGDRLDEDTLVTDDATQLDANFNMIIVDLASLKTALGVLDMGDDETIRVVFGDPTPEMAYHFLTNGVQGIVPTNTCSETLAKFVDAVIRGEKIYEKKVIDEFLTLRQVKLSPRESQLVTLVMKGLKNKEIAFRLGIAEGTVKVYLSRLFDKTGVQDRWELALWGIRNFVPTQNQFNASAYEAPKFEILVRPKETLHR